MKAEAISIFIQNIAPVLRADNKPEHIEIYLDRELGKFYDRAFCDGMNYIKGVKE
jgi:hypothetical protein